MVENFLKKISYEENQLDEIKKRISLKSLYVHESIYFFLKEISYKDITYNKIWSIYIYDKKIRNVLFKYISLIEEHLRSKILNSILDNDFLKKIISNEHLSKSEVNLFKGCSIDEIYEKISFWLFSKLIKVSLSLNLINDKNYNLLINIRNQVFHNGFLIIKNDNKKFCFNNEVNEYIKIISEFIEFNDIKKQFFIDINKCSKKENFTFYESTIKWDLINEVLIKV